MCHTRTPILGVRVVCLRLVGLGVFYSDGVFFKKGCVEFFHVCVRDWVKYFYLVVGGEI